MSKSPHARTRTRNLSGSATLFSSSALQRQKENILPIEMYINSRLYLQTMVTMYKLQLTVLEQEILNFLFIRKGEVFTGRALAVALNVSQPGVGKALKKLEKEDYIKVIKNKETKRLSISLSEDNVLIQGLKRANNIKLLYESRVVEELSKKFPGTIIILFGSYAWGEDTTRSDIDIAIIGTKQKEINLEAFEKKLEREININFYGSFKRIDKHLLSNILNGITIKGAIEL